MPVIYTNEHGMPDALAAAVEYDEKSTAGDISVTQLIDAPRIRQLLLRNTVKVDVSERLWAILGKGLHKVVERYVDQAELQLVADMPGGGTLSGTMDELSWDEAQGHWVIRDWKFPSAWVVVFGGEAGRAEWEAQLNVYAWLCENAAWHAMDTEGRAALEMAGWPDTGGGNGLHRRDTFEVGELHACMVFRDWTAKKAEGKNYPKKQWRDAQVDLWDPEIRDVYVKTRWDLHRHADTLEIYDLPLCEPSERWEGDRRCRSHCDARSVCSYAQELNGDEA